MSSTSTDSQDSVIYVCEEKATHAEVHHQIILKTQNPVIPLVYG